MFNHSLGFVLLFVANPLKSAEFYHQVLGLKTHRKLTYVCHATARQRGNVRTVVKIHR